MIAALVIIITAEGAFYSITIQDKIWYKKISDIYIQFASIAYAIFGVYVFYIFSYS